MKAPLHITVLGVLAGIAVSSCASGPAPSADISGRGATRPACDPERDRAAILRMAGSFDVDFTFEETVPLVAGYEPRDAYTAHASEVVQVLEASRREVSLQHVLLIPRDGERAMPLKHWRQDWTFEDAELLEFAGNRIWRHRELDADEIRCTWSQAVYQVDDGPRYESFGRFVHRQDGTAVWTSKETWRPLPRREYTKRDDYDVLIAVNRHVISDEAWIHEQTNEKWVLEDGIALVQEKGRNTYRRTALADASVARDYLIKTGPFWLDVREQWASLLDASRVVRVHDKVDGARLHLKLFGHAIEMARERPRVRQRYVVDTLSRYVVPLDAEPDRFALAESSDE